MSFEEMLKSLQREYLASIPEKIKVIEGQMAASNLSDFRESFHKLKGTGRTYGMPEVSEVGALVEAVCLAHPVNAFKAGVIAIAILHDVFAAHTGPSPYSFVQDPRIGELQKLLPK
jgi:HPt (histidine-containing phosphotransfer) domain-containing protein